MRKQYYFYITLMLSFIFRQHTITSSNTNKDYKMEKAIKKPLLIGFIELERDFISLAAMAKGISQGAYVRSLVAKQLVKEGYDKKVQA